MFLVLNKNLEGFFENDEIYKHDSLYFHHLLGVAPIMIYPFEWVMPTIHLFWGHPSYSFFI